jgi:DNA-binding winged helix-turn-helix (wHTH) protein
VVSQVDDMRADVPSPISPASPRDAAERIVFGPFRLAPAERRLERGGKVVRIGGRALDILIALAAQPRRVVSKAQLAEAAWPGMVVEDANLRFHIGVLRKALDQDLAEGSFITTVAGRGYSLSAAPAPQPVARAANELRPVDAAHRTVVGRDVEEAELANLLNQAAAGEAQLAFVTGEAGIGKSAVAARTMQNAAAAGAKAVIGRCLPSNAETDAYYPVLDILTQLAGVSDDFATMISKIAPAWAVQLPVLTGRTTGRLGQDLLGVTPHRMSRELCALLEIVASQQLLVLVIEDLHWADQATLDLLRAIANRRLKSKLLILVTLRPSDGASSSRAARALCDTLAVYRLATEIPLGPLTKDQIGEYLARVAGGAPSPELSRHLHARSGGNPLFMRTMIEHWAHEGLVAIGPAGLVLPAPHHTWDLPAPPSLARLIDDDIERLARDRQLIIHAASVSEGVFSAAINHAATPFDEATFEDLCEDLARATALIERAEVLSLPDGRKVQGYAFRHMLFRDVAYDRQSATVRAAAHAAVAARVEQIHRYDLAPVAITLARHFLEAQDWVSAVRYLRLAARVALGRFSPREAAAALEQALVAAQNYPPTARAEIEVEIKEELAPIYGGSLDPRAPQLFAQLVSDAARVGRIDIQCWALIGQAVTAGWSDWSLSLEPFGEALVLSERLTDAAERARIRTHAHGWCSWGAGWDPAHAAGCETAVEELRRLGEPVALAEGLANYAKVLLSSARYMEAYRTIASSVEVLATGARDSRADLSLPYWHMRLGMPWCLLFAGRLGQSFELSKVGVKALLENAEFGRAATLQFYEALGHILLHDFAAAAALVDEAVCFCTSAGSAVLTPNEKQMEMAVRGLTALGQGKPAAAMGWLEQAGQEAGKRRTLSSWYWGMVIEWAMTDACLAAGQLEAARAHAGDLHALAYRTRERTWRALASESGARIALADRDFAAARAHLREAWEETALGRLPLAEWRLHAVEATLRAQEGDEIGAAHHRNAWTKALARLARTLPAEHIGQQTLKAARPVFGRSEA